MYITDIELKNFRNYEALSLHFNEKVNLILGDNAQGKTNLIEAIYLSSIGKSFRTSRDAELIRFGEESAKVTVSAVKDNIDTVVEILINAKGKSSSEKFIKKDRKNITRSSQLLNNIMIVVFSPEDLKIVKDEPEKRRRFIDRELCQISPQYYDCYTNYRKALLQRNALLKEDRVDREILDIWDEQLAKYGSTMIMLRDMFIKEISGYSAAIHAGITDGKETLKLKYLPNFEPKKDVDETYQKLYVALEEAYESDRRNRTTSVGPHRDDIAFYVNDVDMRSYGSQGQQRTCALSLKLAELNIIREDTGEEAILLLDDVMSELDASRQEYLIDTMKENQLFITTTDLDPAILAKFSEISIFRVKEGKIERE